MTPEQVAVLADEDSPAFFAGSFELALGALRDTVAIQERFRTGAGFGWHEHHPDLFVGHRAVLPARATSANLVPAWLPALDGVVAKLSAGAQGRRRRLRPRRVDDPDGAGVPASTFLGIDYHEASIGWPGGAPTEAGVAGPSPVRGPRTRPNCRAAGYDLVTMFDCLHDMGDPAAAARAARRALADDGTSWSSSPPPATASRTTSTLSAGCSTPRSTLICTPSSLAQPGGAALGAAGRAGPVCAGRCPSAGFGRSASPPGPPSTSSSKPVPDVSAPTSPAPPRDHRERRTVMSSLTTAPATLRLTTAIESRDADAILGWYAAGRRPHGPRPRPPADGPSRYRGLDEIGDYYRDMCGRNIEHEVRDAVATERASASPSTAATRTAPASCAPRSPRCVTAGSTGRPPSRSGTADDPVPSGALGGRFMPMA